MNNEYSQTEQDLQDDLSGLKNTAKSAYDAAQKLNNIAQNQQAGNIPGAQAGGGNKPATSKDAGKVDNGALSKDASKSNGATSKEAGNLKSPDTAGSIPQSSPTTTPATKAGAEATKAGTTGSGTTVAGTTGTGTTTASAGGAGAASAGAGTAGGAGGTVAGGSAGGPVGIAAAIVVALLPTIKEKAEEGAKVGIFAGFMIFVVLFALCSTLITRGSVDTISISQTTEFQEGKLDGRGLSIAGEVFKEDTEDIKEFNDAQPYKNAIYNYVYGKDWEGTNDGFRHSLSLAIRKHCKAIIENLAHEPDFEIKSLEYDPETSLECFYENRWPYDLGTEEFQPKIGNVMQPTGFSYDIWHPMYDDVNYAEIFTIISMRTQGLESEEEDTSETIGFDWGEVNYEKFMEFTLSEDCYKYLYELGLTWAPIYEGERLVWGDNGCVVDVQIERILGDEIGYEYESPEAFNEALESGEIEEMVEKNGVECYLTKYYVKSVVKPFGLRELFKIAFPDDDPFEAGYYDNIHFFAHNNIQILNYVERVTRLYQRGVQIKICDANGIGDRIVDALGPTYKEPRSELSPIYEELISDPWLIEQGLEGTGRSAWYYIETTYNDEFNEIWGEESNSYKGKYTPKDIQDLLSKYGSAQEKLRELFPDGIPTSEDEMAPYLESYQVIVNNADGTTGYKWVQTHYALKDSVQSMFQDLYDSGFVVTRVGSYNWRGMAGASSNRSHHSYGVAIDINDDVNPFVAPSRGYYDTGVYDPVARPDTTLTDKQATIFAKYGWVWGGDWTSSKDYMHISYTGY